MKSKIMIDFGHDYKPVIKITRENSEDVRDKLVDSFFQEWGFDTNLLFMAYHSHPGSDGREYTIATMPDEKRFKVFGEEMLKATNIHDNDQAVEKVKDFFQWFGHVVGYDCYKEPLEEELGTKTLDSTNTVFIHNNSHAFIAFLQESNIEFTSVDHGVTVSKEVDLYSVGYEYGRLYERSNPKK